MYLFFEYILNTLYQIQLQKGRLLCTMKDFRPIKQEKTVISIRIDVDVLKKIDKLSNDTDISRNEFIVQCIDFAIKNLRK